MTGMSFSPLHSWDLSSEEAIGLQRELAPKVVSRPLPRNFGILGAADIGYALPGTHMVAVVLTFKWPDLEPLEAVHAVCPVKFPYISGLLSFREIPPLIEAFKLLQKPPDVFLCDGQGIAHPRKFGLAAHFGLFMGLPTVGCAKTRLCGKHDPLEPRKGRWAPLCLRGEEVGCVLCSRDNVKPLYVSPGHLSDIESSRDLIMSCLGRYRIPEPLRQAHLTATRLRRELIVPG